MISLVISMALARCENFILEPNPCGIETDLAIRLRDSPEDLYVLHTYKDNIVSISYYKIIDNVMYSYTESYGRSSVVTITTRLPQKIIKRLNDIRTKGDSIIKCVRDIGYTIAINRDNIKHVFKNISQFASHAKPFLYKDHNYYFELTGYKAQYLYLLADGKYTYPLQKDFDIDFNYEYMKLMKSSIANNRDMASYVNKEFAQGGKGWENFKSSQA